MVVSRKADGTFRFTALCSAFINGPQVLSDDERCSHCSLFDAVLNANVPPWWNEQLPFRHRNAGGYRTIASHFFALKLLEVPGATKAEFMATATGKPPPMMYTKWQLAGTFKRLQQLIAEPEFSIGQSLLAAGESESAHLRFKERIPVGCHYCGTAPAFGRNCLVCGSTEINRGADYR